MPEKETANHGFTVRPGDVIRAVFRYKWLLVFFSAVGFAAGAAIYSNVKPVYRSTAKLVVRYVADRPDMLAVAEGERVRAPDSRGDNIINTELEILKSWDLAVKVASTVGPERIVASSGAATNSNLQNQAAGKVAAGIKAEAPKKSNIITVSYEHPDRDITPVVLAELLDQYLAKHYEIHRAVANFEFLAKQRDDARSKLAQIESELRTLKNQANIISVDDSRRAIAEQLAVTRRAILEVEAQLAERRAALPPMSAAGPIPAAIAGDDTNKTAVAVPPSEAASLYRLLSDRIHALRQKELDMSAIYSGENPLVIGLRKQIAEVERQKTELEGVYPGLVQTAATATPAASSHLLGLDLAYSDRVAQVAGLEARMRVLTNQLERATVEARAFDQVENSILKLQRQRDLEEARLKRLESSLEQATIDTALDSSKISNISIAQAPSPPVQDSSRRTNSAALAAGAGVLIGLLLALFLDLVLDQSVRRASELERRFRLPVFMTIPVFKAARLWGNGRQRLLWGGGASKQVGTATETVAPPSVSDSPEALRPFYEGLRDRLLLHFENVTRRPKVIALSGCTPGSGATTLAAGLAAALSETGDGNVLLVDLNLDQGAAHPFYRGKQLCGLADILEHEKRGAGLVQDNLFLASATGANGSGHHPVLSKKVVDLMPRLRASDYDYIIFDLPPISPTSVTFRLAGYMDLVLLVVESARTSKHKVRDAMALLGHAKAKVGAILNKQRKYVPEWVHHGS